MGYEIDFLAVGEESQSGDAIALRFGDLYGSRNEQNVVVIDGGFKDTGEKLVKHIKHYYETDYVDLVISTHPDADHASGLEVVLDELGVGRLWLHQPWNHTDDIARMFKDGRVTDTSVRDVLRRSLDDARTLERLAVRKGILLTEPFEGLVDSSGCIRVLGPTVSFYESLLPLFRSTPEPEKTTNLLRGAMTRVREIGNRIAEAWNFETLDDKGDTAPENESSVILLLTFSDECFLFTADAGQLALNEAISRLGSWNFDFSTLKSIQVPHHGSQHNVGPAILDRIVGPKLQEAVERKAAFVSVSRNGEPRHPSRKVTNAFLRRGAPVYATNGKGVSHKHNAPLREGWINASPLQFYYQVEE